MINTLKNLKVLLSKNDAYLMYFLLESQEGICFYSTLPSDPIKPGLAIIELKFDVSTAELVQQFLNSVQKQKLISFEVVD